MKHWVKVVAIATLLSVPIVAVANRVPAQSNGSFTTYYRSLQEWRICQTHVDENEWSRFLGQQLGTAEVYANQQGEDFLREANHYAYLYTRDGMVVTFVVDTATDAIAQVCVNPTADT